MDDFVIGRLVWVSEMIGRISWPGDAALRSLLPWLHEHEYVAVWVTGIGTVALATGVVVALIALWNDRRTRDGELVSALSQRWDDSRIEESMRAYSAHGPTGIVGLAGRLYAATPDQPAAKEKDLKLFSELIRWPSLIETIGVLHDHHAISTKIVYKMWGPGIAAAWKAWDEPARTLRSLDQYPASTFPYFEKLAKKMEKREIRENRKSARKAKRARKLRAAGRLLTVILKCLASPLSKSWHYLATLPTRSRNLGKRLAVRWHYRRERLSARRTRRPQLGRRRGRRRRH